MQKIRYGVWFHGSTDEPESICYDGRDVFLADYKVEAEIYAHLLLRLDGLGSTNKYSVCVVTIDEME